MMSPRSPQHCVNIVRDAMELWISRGLAYDSAVIVVSHIYDVKESKVRYFTQRLEVS